MFLSDSNKLLYICLTNTPHVMMLDIYDFYNRMERNNIMLSFKGDITSELLTSILQIMESKLDTLNEEPKVK